MAKSKAKDTKKNTADVGFEDQLWNAADVLRGNLDAAEYKNVVLGLIFLKYLSDRFDERYLELVEEGYGDEEDRDCYMEQHVFFVPEEARWANISQAAHTPEIGQIIDNAMRAIERENDKLKDVLPKNFARPELDKRRLGDVVDLFTNVQMTDNESEKDLLGRAYEYCLQKFASMEGKNAGEFYTPSCIVRTLVEILQPFPGRVYDPCCGSGGMFVQSAAFVEHHGGNVVQDITIFGQESNPTTWKLAKMNLGIRGIEADLGIYADTFSADQHKNEKFDFVLANPPFNLKNWGGEALQEDVRWKYGLPPTGNVLRDSLFRLRDTAAGIAVALVVNAVIVPYNNIARIRSLLTQLRAQIPQQVESSVIFERFPDLQPNVELLRRSDHELQLYHNQRFFHRRHDEEAALRGCRQRAGRMVEELEAICGMDTLGDLSTENAETMRTLGMAIPEAGIAGRKCTRHDTIVMNYHLEKLLSACRYLAELMEQPE